MAKQSTKQGEFPETLQKDVLRRRDLSLLSELSGLKARRLRYCGLAGENAHDVILWREFLEHVTVVERRFKNDDEEIAFEGRLVLRLNPYFNGNVEIIYDDVWNYLSSTDYAESDRAPDVINLDFCGGLLNETRLDYPKQRTAFQGIFERARLDRCDFLLLLTLLPRDQGKTAYKRFLSENVDALSTVLLTQNAASLLKQLELNKKFHERDNLTLFKACLPLLIDDIGRGYNYRVTVRYIRLYTKMIHLVFNCSYVSGVLGLPADTLKIVKILNAPICRLETDGRMTQTRVPQILTGALGAEEDA